MSTLIIFKISDAISKAGFSAPEDQVKKLRQSNSFGAQFKPKYGHLNLSIVSIVHIKINFKPQYWRSVIDLLSKLSILRHFNALNRVLK